MATLVLEVMDGGAGQVVHHPADAFSAVPDHQFSSSLEQARAAARTLVPPEVQRCDGCWRLLQGWSWKAQEREKLSPAAEANGRSASGAAARGWWFALTGKVPDDGVIVVAQVDEHNVKLLKGFAGEGMRAKTRAIAKDNRFDTIVVASEDDEKAAGDALGKGSHIRVVKLDVNNP